MSIRGRKSEVDQLAGSTRNGLKWSAVILARIFQTGPNSPRSELGTLKIVAAQRRQSARMGKESAASIGRPRSRGVGAESAENLRAAQVRPPVTPPRCFAGFWLALQIRRSASPEGSASYRPRFTSAVTLRECGRGVQVRG